MPSNQTPTQDARDDVAVGNLLVRGVRMADLVPENLTEGSPAWNAAAAYKLIAYMPHAAAHFENVARKWAALANADLPATTSNHQERRRDQ